MGKDLNKEFKEEETGEHNKMLEGDTFMITSSSPTLYSREHQ